MAGSNLHLTILTININGLNAPIKRHRLANWVKIQDPSVCCIQQTHLTCKDTQRLKGMEEDLLRKWRGKKKPGVEILVSDKMNFKPTKIKIDKE